MTKDLYDVTDSERIERDWQQEERAQSRFLEETYNWIPVCENCGQAGELHRIEGFKVCEVCAEEPAVHTRGEQLNLFQEIR